VKRSEAIGQRLVAVFMMGWLLLNWPILPLFSRDGTVGGVPLLYAWIFSAWVLLIGLMCWVVERRRD
jgi:hypothetical protein